MTGQPGPAARAATVALKALGRSQQDQRTAEAFTAALWRETDASLRRDPSRWPWTSTAKAKRQA